MTKKNNCLYTNMLNRLTILDEHMHEMQATLEKVREMVKSNINNEPAGGPLVEERGDPLDRFREICLQTIQDIDSKNGES